MGELSLGNGVDVPAGGHWTAVWPGVGETLECQHKIRQIFKGLRICNRRVIDNRVNMDAYMVKPVNIIK